MTNEDAINRKQSLSLVFSLCVQEETRPFQWVTQARAQARTRSSTSIMYQALFTYLTLQTPNLSALWLENSHTDYREKCDTAEDMIMRHAYCQPWLLNRTEKSGYLWISKRKRFLSYFTSYLMLLCFLFLFPVDGQWPMSETWTWLNIPGFNVTLRVQY